MLQFIIIGSPIRSACVLRLSYYYIAAFGVSRLYTCNACFVMAIGLDIIKVAKFLKVNKFAV